MLAPDTLIYSAPDGSFLIELPSGGVALRGATADLATNVLRHLDQPRSPEVVAARLGVATSTVERLLGRLAAQRIVIAVDALSGPGRGDIANAALQHFPDAGHGLAGSAGATILLSGDAELVDVSEAVLADGLDVDICRRREPDDTVPDASYPTVLAIHIARRRDHKRLDALDGWCRRARVPYLSAWFEALTAVLTHLVVPHRTACYRCLCLREESARPPVRPPWDVLPGEPMATGPALRLAAADHAMVGLLALRVSGALSGRPNDLPAPTILELDCTTSALSRHPVLRVPHCPSCWTAL